MNIIIYVFIFSLVLFFYLHIVFQYKKSNDLEIYELENISKEKLEEITNLKQPLIFNYNNNLQEICKKQSLLDKYGIFDVKIRNIKKKNEDINNLEDDLYLPLSLANTLKVLDNDKEEVYITDNNMDFIEETNLIKHFRCNDLFIRPYLIQNSNYDICIGSKGSVTPLKYELTCRNYLLVNEGSINIKLFPPKYSKYLYCIKDYENFEFRSEINPWNVESIHKNDFDKVKCLNIELNSKKILSIPPFWWYSIKYNDNTSLCFFKYRTFMNSIAILPELFMKFLQMKNVKRYNFSRITSDTMDTTDTKDTKDTTDTMDTKDTKDTKDTMDIKDTKDTKDLTDTKNTMDIKDIKNNSI